MFINTDSIRIKTPSMANYVSIGQYITEARYGFNKLWGDDTGRNLAGTMSGTLLGIFPKITVQFKQLTKSELEIIVPILDSPRQIVQYYDPNKKSTVTMTTYTSDYEITNNNIIGTKIFTTPNNGSISVDIKNEGFSCSFISIRKRS